MQDLGYYNFDLKPMNVMMTNQGNIYLIDFGMTFKFKNKDDFLTFEYSFGTMKFLGYK